MISKETGELLFAIVGGVYEGRKRTTHTQYGTLYFRSFSLSFQPDTVEGVSEEAKIMLRDLPLSEKTPSKRQCFTIPLCVISADAFMSQRKMKRWTKKGKCYDVLRIQLEGRPAVEYSFLSTHRAKVRSLCEHVNKLVSLSKREPAQLKRRETMMHVSEPDLRFQNLIQPVVDDFAREHQMDMSFLPNRERVCCIHFCHRITRPDLFTPGWIAVTSSRIVFHPMCLSLSTEEINHLFCHIEITDVTFVVRQPFYCREGAIEIFTGLESDISEGSLEALPFSFAFRTEIEKTRVFDELMEVAGVINPILMEKDLSYYIDQWQSEKITNFQYVMFVNIFSGRSLNSFFQYPIFPWILLPTTENGKPVVRDLSNAVAWYKSGMDMKTVQEILYSNEYSVKLLLGLHNTEAIRIECVWRDIIEGHPVHGGAYELIPEYYSKDNEPLEKVIVPEWAEDWSDYVSKNREAIDSQETSDNIHKWIDLIFGHLRVSGAREEKFLSFNTRYSRRSRRKFLDSEVRSLFIQSRFAIFRGELSRRLFAQKHPNRSIGEDASSVEKRKRDDELKKSEVVRKKPRISLVRTYTLNFDPQKAWRKRDQAATQPNLYADRPVVGSHERTMTEVDVSESNEDDEFISPTEESEVAEASVFEDEKMDIVPVCESVNEADAAVPITNEEDAAASITNEEEAAASITNEEEAAVPITNEEEAAVPITNEEKAVDEKAAVPITNEEKAVDEKEVSGEEAYQSVIMEESVPPLSTESTRKDKRKYVLAASQIALKIRSRIEMYDQLIEKYEKKLSSFRKWLDSCRITETNASDITHDDYSFSQDGSYSAPPDDLETSTITSPIAVEKEEDTSFSSPPPASKSEITTPMTDSKDMSEYLLDTSMGDDSDRRALYDSLQVVLRRMRKSDIVDEPNASIWNEKLLQWRVKQGVQSPVEKEIPSKRELLHRAKEFLRNFGHTS